MTGGEAVARMLKAFNIGPMFGMGGFQLLPFYDAARRIGLIHNLTNEQLHNIGQTPLFLYPDVKNTGKSAIETPIN